MGEKKKTPSDLGHEGGSPGSDFDDSTEAHRFFLSYVL